MRGRALPPERAAKVCVAALVVAALAVGCRRGEPPAPLADAGASQGRPLASPRVGQLLLAEQRREAAKVGDADQASREVTVRRAAARALARIADAQSTPRLMRALGDEDAETAAWGAFGLGEVCHGAGVDRDAVVRALAVRDPPTAGDAPLDPAFAIARALGRCATAEAERTLVARLTAGGPRASAAALGLGDVAVQQKALAEETQVALLTAAAGSASVPPVDEAFQPLGRLEHVVTTAVARLVEVARARAGTSPRASVLATRALGRADERAIDALARAFDPAHGADAATRAEAARGLARLGPKGSQALGAALAGALPARDPIALTTLGGAAYGPLLVATEALAETRAVGAARDALLAVAGLPVPPGAPASLVRRVVRLRCAAAAGLAPDASSPDLARCDPDAAGEAGERARVRVLARGSLAGPRRAAFRALAGSQHPRVREAALELVREHLELDAADELAAALASDAAGVVATAAAQLALRPESGQARPLDARRLAAALAAAAGRAWPDDAVETRAALLDAAGATSAAGLVPFVRQACASPWPTLRLHASRALHALKLTPSACDAPPAGDAVAVELGHLLAGPVRVTWVTDGGEVALTLDPSLAPVAATRIADLAREGFYKGLAVHRVVPGFVAQLGDPGGDGYGGAGRSPLRCETSPVPFRELDVGIALAGRDTGSSQLFVTLAPAPHLDGAYTRIGSATGDWAALAEGDLVRDVRVEPLPAPAARAH